MSIFLKYCWACIAMVERCMCFCGFRPCMHLDMIMVVCCGYVCMSVFKDANEGPVGEENKTNLW